jgi:UPF0755 protein
MRTALVLAIIVLIFLGIYFAYQATQSNNVNPSRTGYYINIPTGSRFTGVISILREKGMLRSYRSFDILAKLKGYNKNIKPGRYVFSKNMSNREIVNMLMSGIQSKVKLNLYNVQTKADFSSVLGRALEIDSIEIIDSLNSRTFCVRYNCNTENILTHFIYNDYEFYWNVSSEKLFEEFDLVYHDFWNKERLTKANDVLLSPANITIMASIVEKESMREAELEKIAGVYLNRLRIGMPLQADPTLKFGAGDFNARRVTNFHKQFDSPYNTYKYRGLPPGPICLPRKRSIDAVLNADTHGYLYFCANPDMSGSSVFSKTLQEQNKVAALYRKQLDLRNIKR